MAVDLIKFGEFFKSRREELHLSQAFIADSLGYNKQIVYNWEKGKSFPNMNSWDEIMNLLKIDLNGLLNCEITNNGINKKFDEDKFINSLKDLRIKNKLTQIDLAKKLNINNKTVSSWENGTSLPSVDNFIELSKLFELSYEEFYFVETNNNVAPIPNKKNGVLQKIIEFCRVFRLKRPGFVTLSAAIVIGISTTIVNTVKLNKQVEIPDESIVYNYDSNNNNSNNNDSNPIIEEPVINDPIPDDPEPQQPEPQDPEPQQPEPQDPVITEPEINYSLTLEREFIEMDITETYTIEYEVYPEDSNVIWTVDDESILSVENGFITPKSVGITNVSAYIEEKNDVVATCNMHIMNNAFIGSSDIVDIDEEAYERFYGKIKNRARFYFEDKKSIIYQKSFSINDDFSFGLSTPEFGPYNGYKYEFLGWDKNDDGVVDELPKHLLEDTDFVAVYKKTPTDEVDFIRTNEENFNYYFKEVGVTTCTKNYETLIIPSLSYKNSFEPSSLYNSEASDINLFCDENIKNVIPLEGFEIFPNYVEEGKTPKYEFISFPSTIIENHNYFPKVTINDGMIYGSLNSDLFKNGINNRCLIINYSKDIFDNALSGCSSLEYLYLKTDKNHKMGIHKEAFKGCDNLKYVGHDVVIGLWYYFEMSCFKNTSVEYFDMRSIFPLVGRKNGVVYAEQLTEADVIKTSGHKFTLLCASFSYTQTLDPNINYFMLSGYAYNVYNHYLSEDITSLDNVYEYKYSVEEKENSWHFNANNFPTLSY